MKELSAITTPPVPSPSQPGPQRTKKAKREEDTLHCNVMILLSAVHTALQQVNEKQKKTVWLMVKKLLP